MEEPLALRKRRRLPFGGASRFWGRRDRPMFECWFVGEWWSLAVLLFSLCPASALVQIPADEQAFRAAVKLGESIVFTNAGIIILSGPVFVERDTMISADAALTLSGGSTNRVFEIAPGATLQLRGIELVQGRSVAGGAVYNDRGALVAEQCVFRDNAAIGQNGTVQGATGGNSHGGAIYSLGRLLLRGCSFERNVSTGGEPQPPESDAPVGSGGHGLGGAVFSDGQAVITNCVFGNNLATGGAGGASAEAGSQGGGGGAGVGGALHLSGESVVRSCAFTNNIARGGNSALHGSAGGPSGGGAIAAQGGNLVVCGTHFYNNAAIGANGVGITGAGGEATGSAVYVDGGNSVIERCLFARNVLRGGDGGSSAGRGGGVNGTVCNIGEMLLVGSTFVGNHLQGGAGGPGGGTDQPNGGAGGHSYGGALCNMGTATLRNCTVVSNQCLGGAGGAGRNADSNLPSGDGGRGGDAGAAGVWTDMEHDHATIQSCTFAANQAITGSGGAGGEGLMRGEAGETGTHRGANIGSRGMVHFQNSIFASAGFGDQSFGGLFDMGGNVCSDNTCGLVQSNSWNSLEPRLLPLAYAEAETPTMALHRRSPARNRVAASSSLPSDQRGAVRSSGGRHDVGAYEMGARRGWIVSGSVSDGTNGIAGVKVTLGLATTISDAAGYFEFSGVKQGRYTVAIEDEGGWAAEPSTQAIKVRRGAVLQPIIVKKP